MDSTGFTRYFTIARSSYCW